MVLFFSIYLIVQTIFDLYENFKNKSINFSRIISHLGFGLLIFFISINHIFSTENNFNIRAGEEKYTKDYVVRFEKLTSESNKNYKSVVGNFEIINKKKTK